VPSSVAAPGAGPCLLVIAHPGHERNVGGWIEAAQPTVCVLTDGSSDAASPLAVSAQFIAHAGARRGPIFGSLSDGAFEDALRRGQVARFATLASELASLVVRRRIALVVGDAADGGTPGHAICRVIVDTAVALAARSGQAAANLEIARDGALRPTATAGIAAAWNVTLPIFEGSHGPLTWRDHLRPVHDGLARLAETAPAVC
jgi:hypothetical protein